MNPQLGEIQQAKAEWKAQGDSPELTKQRAYYRDAWKGLVQAHNAGELPSENDYGYPLGIQPVLPTEGQMLDQAEQMDEYEDMQKFLHQRIRFQEGNLYFRLETANPKTLEDFERGYRLCTRSFAVAAALDRSLEGKELEDLEEWKAWLADVLKPIFYGKTWVELEASPPACVASLRLAGGFVFVTRQGATHCNQVAFEVFVGSPYDPDSWML